MSYPKLVVTALLLLCAGSAYAKGKPKGLLTPSKDSLLRQNQAADQLGLERIATEQRVSELAEQGVLVALPAGRTLVVSPTLPQERRYVFSFVAPFLLSLSEQYYAQFHKPLVVDSAVRSKRTQGLLLRYNKSAAPVEGETASAHSTGTAVDLSKRMPRAQLQWLRNMLSYEVAMNHVIVEDERNCLHVMVLGGTE